MIEFVRAKEDRFVFGLTTSQVFAMLGIAVGVTVWQLVDRRPSTAASGSAARAAEPIGG